MEIKKEKNQSQNEINNLKKKNYSEELKNLTSLLDKPLLSTEEVSLAIQKMKTGDQCAKNLLIERNMRLVLSIARKYIGRGLTILELFHEGIIGLITALNKFDAQKGTQFSTYATPWITQSIARAVQTKINPIHIPYLQKERQKQLLKVIKQLQEKLERNPTDEEIAAEMKISHTEVDQIKSLFYSVTSINETIKNSDDTELGDLIADDAIPFEEEIITNEKKEAVRRLIYNSGLTEQERSIILLRFGFYDEQVHSLSDIAKKYNLTPQRINQVEIKALRKLRDTKNIEDFAIYMDNPESCLENLKQFKRNKENKKEKKTKIIENIQKESEPKMIKENRNDNKEEKLENIKTRKTKKEDSVKILEIFNTEEFIEITRKKPLKECVILSLKLGYIDNKYYSTSAIANFLGIEKEEVVSILKKEIKNYSTKLLDQIDDEIEDIPHERGYTKKLSKI